MHPEILEGPQASVLAVLKQACLPGDFYLAGETALVLHLGHRRSVDLVYVVEAEEEPMPRMLEPVQRDEVKAFFLRESRRVFGG